MFKTEELAANKRHRFSTSSGSSIGTSNVPVQNLQSQIAQKHLLQTSGSPLSNVSLVLGSQLTSPSIHTPKVNLSKSIKSQQSQSTYTQSPLVSSLTVVSSGTGSSNTSILKSSTPPLITQGSIQVVSPLANKSVGIGQFYQQQQYSEPYRKSSQTQATNSASFLETNSIVSSAITVIDAKEIEEMALDPNNTNPNEVNKNI